jgi:anaerobic magnesium-protoporphyrin IX monomethyl ester cyclase
MNNELRMMLIYPCSYDTPFDNLKVGLSTLAAILEEKGVYYQYVDYSVHKAGVDALIEQMKRDRINCVGMSCYTFNILDAYDKLQAIKSRLPEVVTISGGPHSTIFPEEALNQGFDIVVNGEGEQTLMELIEFLPEMDMQRLKQVAGISFKGSDGKVVHTKPREMLIDLDSLPMIPYPNVGFPQNYPGSLKLNRKNVQVSMVTSRGCKAHCLFCYRGMRSTLHAAYSPERIVNELVYLKAKFKVNEVFFMDEDFLFDEERIKRLCKLMRGEKLGMIWAACAVRVDIDDHSVLDDMKAAGCYRVGFGIESGSQRVLSRMGKAITLEQAETTVAYANRIGLVTSTNFIVGHHIDADEDVRATSHFINDVIDSDYVKINMMVPYPGTPLYRYLEKRNQIELKDYKHLFTQYDNKALFSTEYLSSEELYKLYVWVKRRYLLNPKTFLKFFRILRKLSDVNTFSYWDSAKEGSVNLIYPLLIKPLLKSGFTMKEYKRSTEKLWNAGE